MKAEMTDIEQQLRFWGGSGETESQACMLQAADEIERLRNTMKNCPPVSESEYVRRLEDEIMALTGRLGGSDANS
jgi:hypothetical protein